MSKKRPAFQVFSWCNENSHVIIGVAMGVMFVSLLSITGIRIRIPELPTALTLLGGVIVALVSMRLFKLYLDKAGRGGGGKPPRKR